MSKLDRANKRALVRLANAAPFEAMRIAIGMVRAKVMSCDAVTCLEFDSLAEEVAKLRSEMRAALAANKQKLLAELVPAPSGNKAARGRGRPPKEYKNLAKYLLFHVASMRAQPKEKRLKVGTKKEAKPTSLPAPDLFGEVTKECQALPPYRNGTFKKWWSAAWSLLLVSAESLTDDQVSKRRDEDRAIAQRIREQNLTITDGTNAIKSHRHSRSKNPFSDFIINRGGFKAARTRLMTQKRTRMMNRDGKRPTDSEVEEEFTQLEDLKKSIASSQRVGTLKKVCKTEWPKILPSVERLLREPAL